jgi:hypothetical protein
MRWRRRRAEVVRILGHVASGCFQRTRVWKRTHPFKLIALIIVNVALQQTAARRRRSTARFLSLVLQLHFLLQF